MTDDDKKILGRIGKVAALVAVVFGGAFWLFIAFLNDIFDAIF